MWVYVSKILHSNNSSLSESLYINMKTLKKKTTFHGNSMIGTILEKSQKIKTITEQSVVLHFA